MSRRPSKSAIQKAVFAGGGTAGHIEPALAVAREWKAQNPQSEILFIGTQSGLENNLVPAAGFQLHFIPRVHIPRKISLKLFKVPFLFISSVRECGRALVGATVLIGFGGYVSGPAYLAARLRRIPIVIHEANARPGLANRFGAALTPFTAISYPVKSGKLSKGLLTGLPLRQSLISAYSEASQDWDKARVEAKRALGFPESKPLIFIFGGSQGSVAINSVISEAAPILSVNGFSILHAVGEKNELNDSISGYTTVHYLSDMATAYLAADFIISRSGAVTCAEFTVLGRYALFIPLPIGNGEQAFNAASLIEAGRAELIEQRNFSAPWLIENADRLLALSRAQKIEGNAEGVDATGKIVALMNHAIGEGR